MGDNYEIEIKLRFPSGRYADIVYQVLRIDKEPPRSTIKKTINLNDKQLIVNLEGDSLKSVRTSLSAFMNSLELACETLYTFGPPATDSYHYYY